MILTIIIAISMGFRAFKIKPKEEWTEYKPTGTYRRAGDKITMLPSIAQTETIYFNLYPRMDTHGAYQEDLNSYTIAMDGTYFIRKKCRAGEIITSPEFIIKDLKEIEK
jgi:hypothetical protein